MRYKLWKKPLELKLKRIYEKYLRFQIKLLKMDPLDLLSSSTNAYKLEDSRIPPPT